MITYLLTSVRTLRFKYVVCMYSMYGSSHRLNLVGFDCTGLCFRTPHWIGLLAGLY